MTDNIPQEQVLSEEEEMASILEHLPAETEIDVVVPSKGLPYFGKEGTVRIRPMTFDDEKAIMTGKRSEEFNAANYLLSRCITNVDIDRVVLIDKLYLLLKLREISYGNDYSAGAVCPHCEYENKLNIQIDQLTVTQVPDDVDIFSRKVHLTKIKKDALISTPIVADERYLEPENIQNNLWRFIKKIGDCENPTIIAKVIEKLPLADLNTLINKISLSEFGVQPQIKYVCNSCKETNLINLPINENFFSVN